MSVDLRTRVDGPAVPLDPVEFFGHDLPRAFADHVDEIVPGTRLLDPRPLAIEVDGTTSTLTWTGDGVSVASGIGAGAAHVRLTVSQLDDLVADRSTFMAWLSSGQLDQPVGRLSDLLDWWVVLRAAIDARPVHTPGEVSFPGRDSQTLDLNRSFTLADDPADLRHFLETAGFLHLTDVFSEAEMAEASADMDRAAPTYSDGDGRSWWAATADGTRQVVRMQAFDAHSPVTAALLDDDRFLSLREIPGVGHEFGARRGDNRIEALFKPIGVVEGISDVPWHKDCSLGRHSYECCSMTVGISVTGADAVSGQLRVVAGSHRALVWPAFVRPGSDLPQIDLATATGDVTVHLSCTMHMAQPPVERERRVMYTGFGLPAPDPAAAAAGRAQLRAGARSRAGHRFPEVDALTRTVVADLSDALAAIVGAEHVFVGDAISDDYAHDEALTATPQMPTAVVLPSETDQVAAVLRLADDLGVPTTARGSGTGLSGACTPAAGGIVVSFERMNEILEIDEENHVAVVQPGVTLAELDEALAPHRLVYPVFPGEYSASLGGNVATNAGGMRAVKYGVTRHHVIGLEAVLASGETIRTGGKLVKTSTGYDLTQLIIGSEGTLALVTEATLRLYPRAEHQATVLAPFPSVEAVTAAVPRVVASGVGPLILEYIDMLTMSAMTSHFGFDLGIPAVVKDTALAYLVVMMEQHDEDRLDADVARLAEHLTDLGAIDVYVLPPQAAGALIDGREKAFWLAKANGADDIVDVVVPRAAIPEFMATVAELAQETGSWIAGCGHAGDGNVHLGVFQPDAAIRDRLLHRLFEAGMAVGGTISGEHGLGTEKQRYFLELEDPVKIDLMRRIKTAFDPHGILNPGKIFG